MSQQHVHHNNTEKKVLVQKIEVLLDVAGTDLPFTQIELERLTTPALRALEYRIRQARADSYADGERRVFLDHTPE